MRHLRSILYAIVLAPAVWALCGVGFTRDPGFVPLLLAGVAYAILVLAPVSPAGPLLAGVVFLGAALWALVSPSTYGDVWPSAGSRIDPSAPGYGLAVLLAVPLLGTALNRRRWQRQKRLGLPEVGTLGASRGTAQPAGVPAGVLETEVLDRPVAADTTAVVAPEKPPTEVVPAVAAESPPPAGAAESVEEPTAAAESAEEPVGAAESVEEPTAAVAEPVTATFAVSSSGEVTDVPREEPTAAIAELDSAQGVAEGQPDRREPFDSAAEPEPAAGAERDGEELTEVMVLAAGSQPAEAATPARSTAAEAAGAEAVAVEAEPTPEAQAEPVAASEPATSDDAGAAEEVAAEVDDQVADDEMTAAVPVVATEREEDRTQVIEMLIATRPTQDLSGRLGGRADRGVGETGTTQIIGPRERAAAAGADHGEDTQVIKLPPAEGEATQVVKLPAPGDGETTQAVRFPAPSDGENTQVLRLRPGTQEATGERTQVLPIPMRPPADQGAAEPHPTGERTVERRVSGERPAANHDDRTTERRPPATSIVHAERPDPADDPTTRLVVPKPGENTGDDNGDVGAGKRTMTVLNLERPRDEAADDTRRMPRRPLPTQRRPDDETTT